MAITNIYKGALERSDIDKIYKGTTLLYEKVLAPQGETWVINESANIVSFDYNISFISNGGSYNHLFTQGIDGGFQLIYKDTDTWDSAVAYGMTFPAQIITWTNEAYRTIIFETEPTGDLLTWLQANAVKQ